jgi:hydroxyacylglutathione hydrolase
MKLTEGLFSYLWENPYENNCNSYLVQGDRTILIDPGHSHFTDQLFKEMKVDGFSPDHVDLIINTLCHPDHMEGLEAFLDTRAKMAMSQEEERYLQRNGKVLFELMGRLLVIAFEGKRFHPLREKDFFHLAFLLIGHPFDFS